MDKKKSHKITVTIPAMQYDTINWKEKALSFENINVSTSIRIFSSVSVRKFNVDWCGQNGYIPNSEKGFGIYKC